MELWRKIKPYLKSNFYIELTHLTQKFKNLHQMEHVVENQTLIKFQFKI